MSATSTPSRASDAGPLPMPWTPMDLTDQMFEVEWLAERANKAHKWGLPKAEVRARLELAKAAINAALELL